MVIGPCVLLQAFIDLCQQPVAAYLDRFNFKSPLLKSMYAVTDGFSGLNGSWQTPGTGMNFLMHNMVSNQEKSPCCIFSVVKAQPGPSQNLFIGELGCSRQHPSNNASMFDHYPEQLLLAPMRCVGLSASWQAEGSS